MSSGCRVEGFEIQDSRGNPTVGVRLTYNGVTKEATVPSGKSAGSREAHELRDADGKGVSCAIKNIQTIIGPLLEGMPFDPEAMDRAMIAKDGTKDKSHLGANAMLGVSIALRRVAAVHDGVPLWKYIAKESQNTPSFPRLYMNVINGGAHANFALPFQEYILIIGGGSPSDAYAKARVLYESVGERVRKEFGEVALGDEGGYTFTSSDLEKPFAILQEVVGGVGGVEIGIDAAATELRHDGAYILSGKHMTTEDLQKFYAHIVGGYGLRSIEDPFAENDFDAFQYIHQHLGRRALIVGDDLTVTNPNIVSDMILRSAANAMIVKPNQIGTLREVYETVRRAKHAGWKLIASHRSGETTDDFIADLAVGIGAYGLKAGAPSQEERRVKYERLIAIEKEYQH